MILGSMGHALPSQLVMFERGTTDGLPLNGAIIVTDLFDTYRMHEEDVVIPQTGGKVSTAAGFPLGSGEGARRAGLYVIDLWADIETDTGQEATIQLRGFLPPLLSGSNEVIGPVYKFQTQHFPVNIGVGTKNRPFVRTVRAPARFVQLRITAPQLPAVITDFNVSAVLRSW